MTGLIVSAHKIESETTHEAQGAKVDPMVPKPYVVTRVQRETPDIYTFQMEPKDGPGMSFAPGQFNMLYVFGVGEVPISICGAPSDTARLTHTVRAVGPGTRAMCALKRGDTMGVRGPFGVGWPTEVAHGKDLIMMAGGVGLPPLRSLICYALSNRDLFHNVAVIYGARTPTDMVFKHEIERWRSRLDLQVAVTVDSGIPGWRGHVGVVTTLVPWAEFDPANTVAAICGPEIMMRFFVMELAKRGVPPERIYVSMERNMQCGVGLCGHCQLGPNFICKDGPVFRFDEIEDWFRRREA